MASGGLGSSLSRDYLWTSPINLDSELEDADVLAVTLQRMRQKPATGIEPTLLPPTKLVVRCLVYGRCVFEGLPSDTTVRDLKTQLADRLVLPPDRKITLSHWGKELNEEWRTLADYRLSNSSQLDMRTSYCERSIPDRLGRVRISCTALETRTIAVEAKTTNGLDLKNRIQAMLLSGEHVFYDKEGAPTAVSGGTLLSLVSQNADEKTGTAAMRLGEEFITTAPIQGEFGKGKPVSAIRVQRGGAPILISDTSVALLQLPPEKQRLSFRGVDISDTTLLYDLGVRQDDCITLEFESPTMPPVLQLLRAPPKPGKEGKSKGGKKKKA
jgi:hypothetical protein